MQSPGIVAKFADPISKAGSHPALLSAASPCRSWCCGPRAGSRTPTGLVPPVLVDLLADAARPRFRPSRPGLRGTMTRIGFSGKLFDALMRPAPPSSDKCAGKADGRHCPDVGSRITFSPPRRLRPEASIIEIEARDYCPPRGPGVVELSRTRGRTWVCLVSRYSTDLAAGGIEAAGVGRRHRAASHLSPLRRPRHR